MNDETPQRPGPSPEHKLLAAFVGTWTTNGVIQSDSSGPATFHATDVYEWIPGRYFLLHRWDAHMPDGDTKGIEIVGCEASIKAYLMHSFDSQGNHSIMHGRVDGDTWRFTGESVRFTGGFRDGGKTFAGVWEQRSSEDAPWRPWMDVELTRAKT